MAKTTSQIVAENKKKREEEAKIQASRDKIHNSQMEKSGGSSKEKTKAVIEKAIRGTSNPDRKSELETAARRLEAGATWDNRTDRLRQMRRSWDVRPASDGMPEQERSRFISNLEKQLHDIDLQLARNDRGSAYLGGVTTAQETRALLQKRLELGETLIQAKKGGAHTDAEILKQNLQNTQRAVFGQQGTLHQGYAANPEAGNDPGAYKDYAEQTRQLRALEDQQRQLDYFQKYDGRTQESGFWGQSRGNFDLGRLSQDSSMAWNEYLENPTEENRRKAETIDQLMTQFQKENWDTLTEDGKLSWVSKDLAGYLPQFLDQLKYQAAGTAIAAPIAFVTGRPGIAKAGAVAGSGMYSMKSMQGAAFKALLEAGLDEATAMEAAKDEAVISSLIEMGDTALDLVTMGGGKAIDLMTKGGLGALEGSVAKLAGKNAFSKFATAMGKYGLNIFSEGLEEGTQGAISIANRERETNGAGSKWELAKEAAKVYWDAKTNRDSQYREEINEQEAGGRKIAAMMGALETGTNKVTSSVVQNHIYNQKYGGSVEALVKEGLEIDPENKLAQQLQKKLDKKKTVSGTEIAKLVEQNEETLRQRDTKTILEGVTERLKELGETGNIDAIAQALTNQAMGEKPTVADRKALTASEFGQRVANEMNPANIRSGEFSSGWARQMKTEKAHSDVFTGTISIRDVADKFQFNKDDEDFFKRGAAESDLTETEFALGVREAFQYGQQGIPIDQIGEKGNAIHLDKGTRNYAYKLGSDARAMEQLRQQKQEANNGTEKIRVRPGGQWSDGADPGGQVPPVGGQTKAAAGEQRTAPGKTGAVGKDSGNVQRKVSARELGVIGGTDNKKIHLVEDTDRRDMQRAQKVAEQHGMEVQFFEGGNLEIEAEDGHTFEARAYVQGNKMLVRADHQIPAHKLARHEAAHHQVERGQVDVGAVYDKMVEMFGGEWYVQSLIDTYVEAYAGSDMTDAEIFEEILCDSVAEINTFGQNKIAQYFQEQVKGTVEKGTAKKVEARGLTTVGKTSREFSIEAKSFASEIESWYKEGQDEDAPAFILGSTGEVLQGLGAIESDLYMWPWKINKILQKHPEMAIQTIQKIPQILEDPVLILKSRNVGRGKQQNTRLVMYGAVKAEDGKPVLAILDLRPVENRLVINDMQKVSSAYTKDNNPVDFVKTSEILHLDKKRTPSLLRTIGFQAPIELQQSGSIGSISYEGQNVNLKGVNFSDVVQEKTIGGKASREAVGTAQIEQSKNLQKQQLEYWLGKPKKRNGKFARPEDVRRVVRDIIGEYQSTVDREETTKAMQKLANLIIKEGDEVVKKGYSRSGMTYDKIRAYAVDIASDVVENSQAIANEWDMDLYAEIKSYLRKMPLRLTEESDIPDFKDFRKRNFGRLLLKKDGFPIDTVWAEMQDDFGKGFFPDDITHPADMLLHLEELLNSMNPVYYNPYGGEIPQNVEACANTIVQKLFSEAVQPVSTYMDKELEGLSRKIQQNEQKIKRLEKQNRDLRRQNETLLETKEKYDEKQILDQWQAEQEKKELLKKYEDSLEQYRDARNRTDLRNMIRKKGQELRAILNNGTKERNVKEGMQETARATLNLVDVLFSDMRMEKLIRNADMFALTAKERDVRDRYLHLAEKRDYLKEKKETLLRKSDESVQAWFANENEIKKVIIQQKEVREEMEPLADQLQDVAKRCRFHLKNQKLVGAAIDEMIAAYKNLAGAEEEHLRRAFDTEVCARMVDLKDTLADTFVGELNMNQLQDVYDILQMMMSTIRHANKMFVKGNMATLDETVFAIHTELSPKQKKNRVTLPKLQSVEQFHWNNEKPIYAFLRMGSDTLTGLYKNVRKGEDTWYVDTQEAKTFHLETEKKHGFKDWDFDKKYAFQSNTGMDFELSLQEIMSLYAYSKREQAWEHLMKGGFVFDPNVKQVVKTKLGIQLETVSDNATAYNLSLDTWGSVIEVLTKEQKAFVDEMQTYLADTMGGKGNEVSMELYGVKLFREKNYFPLRSAPAYNARVKEQQEGTAKIKNSGFTKDTVKHANNPVVLTPFMDLWADHVNEMSMYHGFALPMEDFYRVYNSTSTADAAMEMDSMVKAIQNAHGAGAVAYIDQLLKDINAGKTADPREGLAKAMTAKFKKASVMASMSVLLRQFSAGPRAWAMVDPKYFAGRKLGETGRKAAWEEMKKYAPITGIKEMGYFDTGLGRSARDYLLAEEYEGFKEKSLAFVKDRDYRDEILGKAPGWADQVTWIGIWNAVKRETRDTRKDLEVGSEAFMQAVGERFTDVIQMTQVYDSVFARSANMRSGSAAMSAITAFMAEPTTTINMVEHAAREFAKGNKKAAVQTLAAVTTAIVLDSALGSLVYALRDDDEDKNLLEKYTENVVGNLLTGMNILTYIPFVRDIWSMLQGYDVERADMNIFGSCIDAVTAWGKLAMQDTSKMDEEELEQHKQKTWGAVLKVIDGMCSMCGSSAKNIRRDILAFQRLGREILWFAKGKQKKITAASFWDAFDEGIKSAVPFRSWIKEETKTERLYYAIINHDVTYRKRIEETYKSQKSLDAAMCKALKENDPRILNAAKKQMEGDVLGRNNIVDQIVGEGNFSKNYVYGAMWSATNELNKGEKTEYKPQEYDDYSISDYFTAASKGDTKAASIVYDYLVGEKQKQNYLMHEAEDAIASGFGSEVKKEYMDNDMEANKATELLVKYGGMATRYDAETEIKKWDFELEYRYPWSARARAYRGGDISEQELIGAVMDIEDETRDEAKAYIRFLDLEMENENTDITASDAASYFKHAEPAGIKVDVYLNYKEKASKCQGEKDEYGETVRGSKKAQLLQVIDALPVSKEQKDALYFANEWSAKTIDEAPWH